MDLVRPLGPDGSDRRPVSWGGAATARVIAVTGSPRIRDFPAAVAAPPVDPVRRDAPRGRRVPDRRLPGARGRRRRLHRLRGLCARGDRRAHHHRTGAPPRRPLPPRRGRLLGARRRADARLRPRGAVLGRGGGRPRPESGRLRGRDQRASEEAPAPRRPPPVGPSAPDGGGDRPGLVVGTEGARLRGGRGRAWGVPWQTDAGLLRRRDLFPEPAATWDAPAEAARSVAGPGASGAAPSSSAHEGA